MIVINYTTPKLLIAEKGKKIRAINDVYEPEHIDEEGNLIEEHFPYYTNLIYLSNSVDENEINELYVEEIE